MREKEWARDDARAKHEAAKQKLQELEKKRIEQLLDEVASLNTRAHKQTATAS